MRALRVGAVAWLVALAAARAAGAGVGEPLYVVDSPTAGLLEHGEYHLQARIGPESSILTSVRVGIGGVAQVGLAFGVQRLFERGDVDVNDRVGLRVRVRLIEEGAGPALAVGFDGQGTGRWDAARARYARKSRGFYAVLSRNWRAVAGEVSLHGGASWSTENDDGRGRADVFAAVDWGPLRGLSVRVDWAGGFNDDAPGGPYGRGRTWLDAAVRVRYGAGLTLMLTFRDLTGNHAADPRVWRELEVAFVDLF